MMKKIFDLEEWELDKKISNRNRQVNITIDLAWMDVELVKTYPPSQRRKLRGADLVNKFKMLISSGLIKEYQLDGTPERPSRITTTVPYSSLSKLAKLDYVWHIWIKKISDAKKIKQKSLPQFYCVKMTVAIQIEG